MSDVLLYLEFTCKTNYAVKLQGMKYAMCKMCKWWIKT